MSALDTDITSLIRSGNSSVVWYASAELRMGLRKHLARCARSYAGQRPSSGSGGAPLRPTSPSPSPSPPEHISPSPPRPRLHTLGQVYVTLSAAGQYAESRHLRDEEARRELTELLLEGYVTDEGPPARVRARRGRSGLDISATIVREGRLLVVLTATARHYR